MPDFKFIKETKIIEVGIADTEVTVQQLYDACRDFEDENYNMEMYKVVDGSGKEELGASVRVGITIKLIDWKLKFADRPPPDFVVCDVSGGNLVCYDTVQAKYVNPIEPAAYVTVTKTSSSSATLQDLEAVQYASFQNAIWIDVVNGQSGVVYPIGTVEYPVDNLADAKIIAQERGFHRMCIVGNYDFQATDDIEGFDIMGENAQHTVITVASGCSTIDTRFDNVFMSGVLSGAGACFHRCELGDLSGLQGTLWNCIISGNLALAGTPSDIVMMIECYLGTQGVGLFEIDMGGDGPALGMRAYTGGLRIKNKSGAAKVAIDFVSGRLELMNTVTAGTFFIRGVGEITVNNSTGCTFHTDPLTQTIKTETDKIAGIDANILDILSDTAFISEIEGGKWEISGDEMIFYKADNVTEIARFTIARDANNNPIMRTRQ